MSRFLPLLIFIVLLASCKKELDFEYHEIEPLLVIEGQLTQAGCEARLTYTTPMNEYMDTTRLIDAKIILRDLTDDQAVDLTCNEYSVFVSEKPGKPGHAYELEVTYKDMFYASKCVMRPASEILNLEFSWLKMPYDYVAILEIKFKELEGNDPYYWIKIYRNGKAYQWILCDNRSA